MRRRATTRLPQAHLSQTRLSQRHLFRRLQLVYAKQIRFQHDESGRV